MNIRSKNALGARVQDDGPVHLGELGKALLGETGIAQRESARAQLIDGPSPAQHNQGTGTVLDDPLDSITELSAGRESSQHLEK